MIFLEMLPSVIRVLLSAFKNPPTFLCFLFNVRRFYATCFSLIFSLFSIVPGSLTKAIVTRFYITCHVIWQNCSGYSFSKIPSVTKVSFSFIKGHLPLVFMVNVFSFLPISISKLFLSHHSHTIPIRSIPHKQT